jgi:hypothetical protein
MRYDQAGGARERRRRRLYESIEELDVSPEGTLELSFKPYEIETIRMEG